MFWAKGTCVAKSHDAMLRCGGSNSDVLEIQKIASFLAHSKNAFARAL